MPWKAGRCGKHEGERTGPEFLYKDFCGLWNVGNKRVQVLHAPDKQNEALFRFPALEAEDSIESGRVERVGAQAIDSLGRIDDNTARSYQTGSLNNAGLIGRKDRRPFHCQKRLPGRKRTDGGVCS